jgi:NAD(P)-dependent dehydrogenase (short-subunit alcohol dehydrogenase family)
MDFSNKNIIVTGASGGIGRAIAHQFAAGGGRVLVHYHSNADAAAALAESLPGSGHVCMAAELGDPELAEQLVSRAVDAFGHIDVLVNNAGIYEEHPILKVTYSDWRAAWDRILKTNLYGPAHLMYCAIARMKEQGGGRIVNVSSRGAFRGEPDAPAYGASKAGLNALGQSLAKALGGEGIFVFTVAPGFVETKMAQPGLTGPKGDFIRNESPLGRVAKPEEVARTVAFLASEGSEFLTGCIVDVNGASYLRT